MAKQYSVQFFTSFVDSLQDVCRNYLNYSKFVEVSGYVCVEIDNMKKERYVLSELLHSSGNVVSESYCTKAFKTAANTTASTSDASFRPQQQTGSWSMDRREEDRNSSSRLLVQPNIPHGASISKVKRRFSDTFGYGDPSYNQNSGSVSKRSVCSSDIDNQRYRPPPSTHQSLSSPPEYPSNRGYQTAGNAVQEKKITVPSCLQHDSPRTSNSEQSPVAASPRSNIQESGASDFPAEEEVIDLDLFDDDLDVPGVLEEEGHTVSSGGTLLAGSYPQGSSQQRKTQLSPGSLVAVNNAVRRFKRFISFKYGEDIDLLKTTPERLNEMMLVYFKESRKKDGGELAGVSMKNIVSYLELFLRDNGYPYSVSKGQQFQAARDYIKNKMEDATKTMSQVMSPVDDMDIETLFQAHQLGSHTPDSLSNTMWFLNSKFLTVRRPAEHFSLKWGDINLKVDREGNEYLERPINEIFGLKLFANLNQPNRCFVNFYKQFRAQRPKLCLDDEAPFYLKPNKSPGDEYWFSPEPMSWNMLCSLWRKMVVAAGLPLNKRIV